ncbi:MAG: DUF2905 family protein [Anaerohalosphaera sp.]|nr:DUF2905 family protein [Anaerohalosphaera sp.]
MDFGPQQLGKLLIFAGVTIAILGLAFFLGGRIGLFRLPGDLQFGSKTW